MQHDQSFLPGFYSPHGGRVPRLPESKVDHLKFIQEGPYAWVLVAMQNQRGSALMDVININMGVKHTADGGSYHQVVMERFEQILADGQDMRNDVVY